jgi:hypothetical protein
VVATAALMALLDAATRGLRRAAARLQHRASLPLALRLALAGLQQPAVAAALRRSCRWAPRSRCWSACTLVVATLLRTVNETVPAQAPALVFHDVQSGADPAARRHLAVHPGPAGRKDRAAGAGAAGGRRRRRTARKQPRAANAPAKRATSTSSATAAATSTT